MGSDAGAIAPLYASVFLGGGVWLVSGGFATLLSYRVRALRHSFPLTWRIWSGGSVGFIPVSLYMMIVMVDANFRNRLSGMELLYGPILAALGGVAGGAALGARFAPRRI